MHCPENIRRTLEQEIPDIRTGDSFGVLFGLFMSVFLLSCLGLGLAFMISGSPSVGELIGFPVLVLVLSYFVGQAFDGSNTIVGADIAQDSAEEYARTDGWGDRGDWAETGMQVGMVLMFLQMLAGGVYGCIKYMRERGTAGDTNVSRIASAFVCHLLQAGPTKQDALFSMDAISNCQIQEKREALQALVSHRFVQSLPTGVQIAPEKRHHFTTL